MHNKAIYWTLCQAFYMLRYSPSPQLHEEGAPLRLLLQNEEMTYPKDMVAKI